MARMARIASINLRERQKMMAVAPSARSEMCGKALGGVDAGEDGEEIAVEGGGVGDARIAEHGGEDRAEGGHENQGGGERGPLRCR